MAVDTGDDQFDLAALGELHRVVGEVREDLLEAERVAHEAVRNAVLYAEDKLEPLLVGRVADDHGDLVEHAVEQEGEGLYGEHPCLDLGEVEDLVDDAQQRCAGRVNLADIVALLIIEVGAEREVREPDDGVHRRSDLVAHVGEKHRFRFGRRQRLSRRFAQLCGPFDDGLLQRRAARIEFTVSFAQLGEELFDRPLIDEGRQRDELLVC